MSNKDMTILIFGGGGFIGRNLREKLNCRYRLLTPSRMELDLLDGGAVEKYLERNPVDVVIHAAAVGVTRDKNSGARSIKNNLQMFYNLARRQELFGKMIFCGSGAVYNKSRDLVLVKEEEFGKSLPRDPYGVYKYECSKYIEQSKNIVDLRLFGVYGKYEDYVTRFISNAICRALLGLPVNIYQDVKFEYLYVGDLAKIAEYFILHPATHKSYNVGTGQPVSLTALAEKIEKISGKKLDVSIKLPGWNKEYTCDNSRLMGEVKKFQFTALDTAIGELYNWYKGNLNQIDKEKLLSDQR